MSAITKEAVLLMDLKSIHAAIKAPETSKEMQNLLRDRQVVTRISDLMQEAQNREAAVDAEIARTVPPTTEELAAQAAASAAAPVAEAVVEPVVVAPTADEAKAERDAEDAELLKLGITVQRDAKGKATRYIEEYQVLGEDGKPIGRVTHLESRTLPELFKKQHEVHTQATRAFNRLKQQKTTFQQENKAVLTPAQIAEAAKKLLEGKDEKEALEFVEEVLKSKFTEQSEEIRKQTEISRRLVIAAKFTSNHPHDYNDCTANGNLMGEYMAARRMDFTLDNLEAAFIALTAEDKLARPEGYEQPTPAVEAPNQAATATSAAAVVPAIPVAASPVVVPAPAAPAQPAAPSQPVVEATVPTSAAAPNAQPAARRPGVSSGIVPGTFSAERPGAPDPALARKQFLQTVKKMDPEVMKQKLKTDPQFVKQLEAYGIRLR